MTLIGLIITIILCILVAVSSRRAATIAVLMGVVFITQGQSVDIASVNFMAIRFICLSAIVRVMLKREFINIKKSNCDKWFIIFHTVFVIVFLIRTESIDTYTIGLLFDATVTFFSFRAMLVDDIDFIKVLESFSVLLMIFSIIMVKEAITGTNIFYFMGGIPPAPVFREGYYRCQGSFRHAITAGTLGATFLPLYFALVLKRNSRIYGIIGLLACAAIVVTSHSSGPLMTAMFGIIGWLCWYLRERMSLVRKCIVLLVLCLHMIMKQPVWFIYDRISGLIGGDGWHRANLIDKFVYSIQEWWLAGMSMEKTVNWAKTVTKYGYVDVTNYYISIGLSSGIFALILFVKLLSVIISNVGSAIDQIKMNETQYNERIFLLWGAGNTVVCHAVNLTGVIYWDQSYVIFYFHLAFAIGIAQSCKMKYTLLSNPNE